MPFYKRPTFTSLLTVVSCAVLLYSCGGGKQTGGGLGIFSGDFVNEEAFATAISNRLKPVDTKDSAFQANLLKDIELNTAYAYQLSGNKAIWFDEDGLKKSAVDFSTQIKELAAEGIGEQYDVKRLDHILKQANAENIATDTLVNWDIALTQMYLTAAKDLLLGNKEVKVKDEQWFAANDSSFNGAAILAKVMGTESKFPSFDSFRPEHKYYKQMRAEAGEWQLLAKDSAYNALRQQWKSSQTPLLAAQIIKKEMPGVTFATDDSTDEQAAAIKSYQYYRQLKPRGKLDTATLALLNLQPATYIDKLQLNMERVRRLPRQIGNEYVWVNIPLMELDYMRDDVNKFHSRVVVGKVSRQTPSLVAKMTNIVFNPPWGVPPTILKNDVGPGVSRSGSGYLARKGLRAYDSKGNDVTGSVNGANYKRFSYRQPPGAHNSLGEVKFNLPNKWDIYIHDTPHRENFGSRMRALSSGCVRVQNPKDFAEIILEDSKYNRSKIDSVIETRKTKHEKLDRNVEVYIVYMTVAPDSTGTRMRYLNDVYKRDIPVAAKNTVAVK